MKVFSLSVISAVSLHLGEPVQAAATKHPFVGEHANASAVPHENGQTVSMRLGAKPVPERNSNRSSNKVLNNKSGDQSILDIFTESLFGKQGGAGAGVEAEGFLRWSRHQQPSLKQ